MGIYIETNSMYSFDGQRTFRLGYMVKNTRSDRGHGEYDENDIGGGGSLLVKDKWD